MPTLKIAVIGWGSLIWDPQTLGIESHWQNDGPMLPIEFARFSSGDRLTLVIVDSVELQQTLWALSNRLTLVEATSDLMLREKTKARGISSCSATQDPINLSPVHKSVREWLIRVELDAAVWTALGPNCPNAKNGITTEAERIDWLKTLVANKRSEAARKYVERTPRQISTPLRKRIRDELGWK